MYAGSSIFTIAIGYGCGSNHGMHMKKIAEVKDEIFFNGDASIVAKMIIADNIRLPETVI